MKERICCSLCWTVQLPLVLPEPLLPRFPFLSFFSFLFLSFLLRRSFFPFLVRVSLPRRRASPSLTALTPNTAPITNANAPRREPTSVMRNPNDVCRPSRSVPPSPGSTGAGYPLGGGRG